MEKVSFSPATPEKMILVVDNSSHIRKFVAANLVKRGFTVVEASGVTQELAMLVSRPPDLTVIEIPYDWQLWLANLQEEIILQGVPLIGFTTEHHTVEALRQVNRNIVAVLVKPI